MGLPVKAAGERAALARKRDAPEIEVGHALRFSSSRASQRSEIFSCTEF